MEQEVVTVGLDLAKNVFQVHAIAADGAVARELADIIAWRGKPGLIVSDNVLGWEAAAGNGQQVSLRRL